MAEQFGKTWWGNEWLRSLTHIDYDNRIPRGATYARKGNVKDIVLKDNIISAKVTGSRITPYKVSITIPPFFPNQTDALMDELIKHPGIISRLLNRELAPEIMSIARACGIKIFPERWTDLKMQCNCPDWAVPCKHIAAVIYMFSREIDNNPFIVFSMHNMDIMEELKKRGISTENSNCDMAVQEIKDVIRTKTTKEINYEQPVFKRIDFSSLKDKSEALLMLLPENPPFSTNGDFKDIYMTEILRAKKNVQRFFSRRLEASGMFPPGDIILINEINPDREFSLHFDSNLKWTVANVCRNGVSLGTNLHNADSLPFALLRINPDFLPDYHPSVIALNQTLMCTLHLLSKGAVAPQILLLSNKEYAIRWIPAYIDSEVSEIMSSLEDIIPEGLIKFKPEGRKLEKCIHNKGEWLVSFFLGKLINRLTSDSLKQPLETLFFKGEHIPFSRVGEKETPGGIKSWIASYTLTESDYRPVIYVDESKDSGFDIHFGIEDMRNPEQDIIALSDILSSPEYDKERFSILRCFTLLAGMMKDLNGHIAKGAKKALHYTNETFLPIILQIIPAVKILDFKVFMPKALQELIRPKASISLRRKSGSEKGFISLADLFAFDWEVALGNESISMEEFMKLQNNAGGLIKFKQKYIYTDANTLEKLHEAFLKFDKLTPSQLLQAALTEEYNSAPIRLTDDVRQLIKELTEQENVSLPKGLNAQLRPYQERGFSWMYRNMRIGFGSVLADDMGLGKTLQAITLILKIKEEGGLNEGKTIIVVPTGLLTNWQMEISRFAPSLSTFIYHGTNRDIKSFKADILLTTYGVLRSDNAKLKKRKWTIMFIDEAQNIKNNETAQSKAVKSIPATTHIALSGTPVENRLTEFWSIMDYANKGYLDTLKAFKENYANPIQLWNDGDCAERFRKVTAPFMMRRMKTDKNIISDLPDKIELDVYASLKPEQAALYEKTLEAAMNEIEGIPTTDNESLFKRQGLILQMIMALKQICNHPAQFLKNGDRRSELSGKTEMLLDRIEGIVDGGEKVLVFTQYREMGDMLVDFITERTGEKPLFYHGGCSIKERQAMIDRFQNNRTDKIFILSLKAAGTGLNLTAATHVIHYDLWWNPAVEAQATDRAYRIGQKNNVIVHRFITKDTFEERINDMIQKKKHLADMTVSSGESWIGKLSNKELREIFG